MNNQRFNAEQITHIYTYIYPESKKNVWKIKSEEQVNIVNSRKMNNSSDMSPLSLKTYTWLLVPKN